MQRQSTTYKGYRFPCEIMSDAVWIYYRLNASLRGRCHIKYKDL